MYKVDAKRLQGDLMNILSRFKISFWSILVIIIRFFHEKQSISAKAVLCLCAMFVYVLVYVYVLLCYCAMFDSSKSFENLKTCTTSRNLFSGSASAKDMAQRIMSYFDR